MEPIQSSKGEDMKKTIGAQAYIECSARLQYNLKEVFEGAIKVVLHPPSAAGPAGKKGAKDDAGGGGCCELI
jgi:Ras-related C3 botulinum toxin substrate 1